MDLAVLGMLGREVLAHLLRHQVPAVTGRVDQHVVGGRGDRAVEGGLERLVAGLALLERQVVAVDDELLGPLGDQVDDVGQVDEVGLVDLDQPQPLVCMRVQAGLDQRGLAGPARAGQQHVVRRQPLHEAARVAFDQPLGLVDVLQVLERDRGAVTHRLQPRLPAERGRTAPPAEGDRGVPVGLGGDGQQALHAGEQGLGALGEALEGCGVEEHRGIRNGSRR